MFGDKGERWWRRCWRLWWRCDEGGDEDGDEDWMIVSDWLGLLVTERLKLKLTNGLADIGDCRVAFVTEKPFYGEAWSMED